MVYVVINKRTKRNQKGFTLVELMAVIAIIGILAAIAIPNYFSYRTKGYDATAKADASNARVAATVLFADNTSAQIGPSVAPLADYGFVSSEGVAVTIETLAKGTDKSFKITASHSSGKKTYVAYPNGSTIEADK